MTRAVLIAGGAALLLSATAMTAPASPTARLAGPCTGLRRAVETFTDSAAGSVNLTPRATTVAAIRRLAVPSRPGKQRISPVETRTYRVTVRLVQMQLEADGDVRLTVVDPKTHQTMLVRFPAPLCIRSSSAAARRLMTAARGALVRACGRADRGSITRVGGNATISGVGFVEPRPRPADAAPNGVALDPVLGFHAARCLLGG